MAKGKPITYTRVFVELYKYKNHGQVHKIHKIVEFEKWHVSMAENFHNIGINCIIEVFLILHNIYAILKNQEKMIFFLNNYID